MPYIYHIINNKTGERYIGQSAVDGSKHSRVWDHFKKIYTKTTTESSDSKDSREANNEKKNKMIRNGGLEDFSIEIYNSEQNYGLPKGVIETFLEVFEPVGLRFSQSKLQTEVKEGDKTITLTNAAGKSEDVNIKVVYLDVAEILHIINACHQGKKITNIEPGGEIRYWRLKGQESYTFSNKMSPQEVHKIFLSLNKEYSDLQKAVDSGVADFMRKTLNEKCRKLIIKIVNDGFTIKKKGKKYTVLDKDKKAKKFTFTEAEIRSLKYFIRKYTNSQIKFNFKDWQVMADRISQFIREVLSSQINQFTTKDTHSYSLHFYNGDAFTIPIPMIIDLHRPQNNNWWIANVAPSYLVSEAEKIDQAFKFFSSILKRVKDSGIYSNSTAVMYSGFMNSYLLLDRPLIGFVETPAGENSLSTKVRLSYKEILNEKNVAFLSNLDNWKKFFAAMYSQYKRKWKEYSEGSNIFYSESLKLPVKETDDIKNQNKKDFPKKVFGAYTFTGGKYVLTANKGNIEHY